MGLNEGRVHFSGRLPTRLHTAFGRGMSLRSAGNEVEINYEKFRSRLADKTADAISDIKIVKMRSTMLLRDAFSGENRNASNFFFFLTSVMKHHYLKNQSHEIKRNSFQCFNSRFDYVMWKRLFIGSHGRHKNIAVR